MPLRCGRVPPRRGRGCVASKFGNVVGYDPGETERGWEGRDRRRVGVELYGGKADGGKILRFDG